jgi:TRAP-type C4-dicarboxylate transport system permease small subunit
MEWLFLIYMLAQIIAIIFLCLGADQIANDLLDGISLLHIIIGILLLPAVIVSTILVCLAILASILWEWIKRLNEIKIIKFK